MNPNKHPTHESLLNDVAAHEMTVILDQAEHRHIRFARPGTSNMHFYITTWPGYLCISGDMGCYVFARVRDMFRFFRGDGINLGYWAEKIQAAERNGGVKEYDSEKLVAYVEEEIKEWPQSVREDARDSVLRHADDEHDARRALYDYERDGHEKRADFCNASAVDLDKERRALLTERREAQEHADKVLREARRIADGIDAIPEDPASLLSVLEAIEGAAHAALDEAAASAEPAPLVNACQTNPRTEEDRAAIAQVINAAHAQMKRKP